MHRLSIRYFTHITALIMFAYKRIDNFLK